MGDDVFALLNCDEDLEYGARHFWCPLVVIRCIFFSGCEFVLLGGKVSYPCLIGGILVKTIAMGNNSMV